MINPAPWNNLNYSRKVSKAIQPISLSLTHTH